MMAGGLPDCDFGIDIDVDCSDEAFSARSEMTQGSDRNRETSSRCLREAPPQTTGNKNGEEVGRRGRTNGEEHNPPIRTNKKQQTAAQCVMSGTQERRSAHWSGQPATGRPQSKRGALPAENADRSGARKRIRPAAPVQQQAQRQPAPAAAASGNNKRMRRGCSKCRFSDSGCGSCRARTAAKKPASARAVPAARQKVAAAGAASARLQPSGTRTAAPSSAQRRGASSQSAAFETTAAQRAKCTSRLNPSTAAPQPSGPAVDAMAIRVGSRRTASDRRNKNRRCSMAEAGDAGAEAVKAATAAMMDPFTDEYEFPADDAAAAAVDAGTLHYAEEAGPSQQAQQQQPSATPAAAAAPLEVSTAPTGAISAAGTLPRNPSACAAAQSLSASADSALAARDWLLTALADPRSSQASCMTLRPSLQRAVDSIATNLENTINMGHNNSLLLVGPRGSGKSLAAERAVAQVGGRYNAHPSDPVVGCVRLVGWAHADERVAFKEIARQLCETFQCTFRRKASLGDNIEFLRAMLSSLARAHKVPVFLLDDFDAFARRPKQTLLYCLLDALQTSGVQAAVVGLTCRHDCLDLLEKRVKSRFSHRTVEVGCPRVAAPREAPAAEGGDDGSDGAVDVLRCMLTLPAAPSAAAEGDGGGQRDGAPSGHALHAAAHNAAVVAALAVRNALPALEHFVAIHPSLRDLGNVAQMALMAAAAAPNGLLPSNAVPAACAALRAAGDDSTPRSVAGLSVLELAVLVAAHRARGKAAAKADRDAINFEMTHHEFRTYASAGAHVDNYTRAAAAKAFDRLMALGLVSQADGRGGRQYAAVYLQVRPEELRAGLEAHPTCPARLREWLAREGGLGTTAAAMY